MDMVERVARAIAKAERMDDNEDRLLKVYTPLAIAAIEALREPTRGLIGAQHYGTDSERRANWLDAIDSILKSTRETA